MLTAADTAYAIAHIRAMEDERPESERLFSDPFAPVFVAAGAHAAEGTKRFLDLPFLADAVRIRTRFIDDIVRASATNGVPQIVLMGAGFDCRGARIPEIAARGVTMFEVDFQTQLDKKRSLLEGAGKALPSSSVYVGCDFTAPDAFETLGRELEARGFRTGAGALFVWEGVLAYIDGAVRDRSLAFTARIGGPGAKVVLDYMPMALEPETMHLIVQRAGFSSLDEVAADVLWRRYRMPGEPHPNAAAGRMGVASV